MVTAGMRRTGVQRHIAVSPPTTFQVLPMQAFAEPQHSPWRATQHSVPHRRQHEVGATGKGILIGVLSALASALLVALILTLTYFLRYTSRGRILLDRIGRPGEFDDEQAFAKEEAEALEEMDDLQRAEYMRAKAFIQANPPESVQTDISLSQFLAIQEKGVSAWEFEPELEIANCFVEGRTEIEFFDSECSVQTNLPVPKQNEVYYWEAKIYDKPDTTSLGIGLTTKPYPLFRLPGYHKTSLAYFSDGSRRFNQPFNPLANYAPPYVRGDVVGVGYRPRNGTVFFTRNGKKYDDVTHSLKNQNLFPTVGANGPCTVHVNFGQMGFVFIEANVKKWGLAPTTGSLAPPPPYGSEQGSILLEGGQYGVSEGQGYLNAGHPAWNQTHGRTRSTSFRLARHQPTSPGPQRSPTDISLTQLSLIDSATDDGEGFDAGEGTSASVPRNSLVERHMDGLGITAIPVQDAPPPEYAAVASAENLLASPGVGEVDTDEDDGSTPRPGSVRNATRERRDDNSDEERDYGNRGTGSSRGRASARQGDRSPPVPYEVAVGSAPASEGRSRKSRRL